MSAEIQKFQAVLSKLLTSSQKFTDEEFRPDPNTSIGGALTKYPFRRASEILDNVGIFPQGIDPNEVRSGALNDVYFLSALAAIAEEPALVERLFLTEESNRAGLYALWLCDNGVWRPILLDDYFPCKQYSGEYLPAFGQYKTGEIWVPLLEKAYAKINRSYLNIESGLPHHVLRDLTGAPIEELYDEPDLEKIWDFLLTGMEREHFLMCSTELYDDDKEEEEPQGHAYTVLDVREVQSNRKAERLILVRNPWDTFEWKGAWSKNSNLWTPELRRELNYPEEEDESLFWMNLQDYQKYFPVSWVCKYRKDNNYYSVNFSHKNTNNNVLRIKVTERQEVTISLNQKDRRYFKNSQHPDYFYSYSRILLGKVGRNSLEYVTGNAAGFERNLQATHVLEPGTYLLTLEINWSQNYCNDFNVSFYSEGKLAIENLYEVDLLSAQKNIIRSAIDRADTGKTKTDYSKFGDPQIQKSVGCIHGIFYFLYENHSNRKVKLCETVKFSQISNLKICSPFTNDNQFDVTVLPGSDLLVLYKAGLDDFSWSYSASFYIQNISKEDERTPGNVYTYIDNPDNKAKIEVNENYNTHVKTNINIDAGNRGSVAQSQGRKTEEPRRSRPGGPEEDKVNPKDKYYEDNRKIENAGQDAYYYYPEKGSNKARQAARGEDVKKPKEFPPTLMQLGQTNSKKVKYTNFDDYEKQLTITSTRPDIIQVKEPKVIVRPGESIDVRLRFYAPREVGHYDIQVEIRLGKSSKVEEVLVFPIENRSD